MIQMSMQDKNHALIQVTTDADQTPENLAAIHQQVISLYAEQQRIAMGMALEAKELSEALRNPQAVSVEAILAAPSDPPQ